MIIISDLIERFDCHDARVSTTLCTTKDGVVQSIPRLTHFLHPDQPDGEMLQQDGDQVMEIEWVMSDCLHMCMAVSTIEVTEVRTAVFFIRGVY